MIAINRIQVIVAVMFSIIFLLCNYVLSYAEVVRKVSEGKYQKDSVALVTKIETFYDNNKQIAQIEKSTNGDVIKREGKIPDGIVKQYSDTGHLANEYNYKNGKRESIAKSYHENGKLHAEENFKNDALEGISKTYNVNGQLQADINYKAHKKDGISKLYYESGSLKLEGNYKADKLEGIVKSYYESGILESEMNFKNDAREGISKSYYENGKLKSEENYKAGKKNGLSIDYNDDDGITPPHIVIFENDKLVKRHKYNLNDKLLTDEKQGKNKLKKVKARDGRFIAYDNGTVLDTRTNLMWAAKDNGSDINWANAKSYCENYRGGGYSNWRMPTLVEVAGLYDASKTYDSCYGYNVHLTELIRFSCTWTWAFETRGSEAVRFGFSDGYPGWIPPAAEVGGRVLPVRSGE